MRVFPQSQGQTGYAQSIFAEESAAVSPTGGVGGDGFQWAFGNGDDTPQTSGVIAMFTGTLTTFALETEGGSATVEIYVNGIASGVTTSNGISDVNLAISKGDIINFRTTAGTGTTSGRVTALIERGAVVTGAVIQPGGTTGQVATLQSDGSYAPQDASGGVDAGGVVTIAEGLDIIAADAAKAASGNPAATTSFVSATVQGSLTPSARAASLANNNFMYRNDAFVGSFDLGEVYEFQGAQGDKITSLYGHSGAYGLGGGNERLVEFATAAGAARAHLWFAFRSAPHLHFAQTLALAADIEVYGPNPTINADGTSPDTPIFTTTLAANSSVSFSTPTNGEYYLRATQPVALTTSNSNGGQDQRVVLPPAQKLFLHTVGTSSGDARISALFANTNVTIYQQDGTIYNGVVNPGSPLSLNGNDGGIDAGIDQSYAPEGWLIIDADAPITAFSGADQAGTAATTGVPVGFASNRCALPASLVDANRRQVNLSVVSEYRGSVEVWDETGVLRKTLQLERSGSIPNPVATVAQQLHPTAAQWRTDEADFTAALGRGTQLIGDVPFLLVGNFDEGNGSIADDDEMTVFGITENERRSDIKVDPNGFKRLRKLSGAGTETWELT